MPSHGGQLRRAAKEYDIPLSDWLDLSTGINPHGWNVPNIPTECWQRLPEEDDALIPAAESYYRCQSVLPIAGSQAAIQYLPKMRSTSNVLIPSVTYSEHASNWRKAGHHVTEQPLHEFDNHIAEHDVVLVVNPNNPTGELISNDTLLRWHTSLVNRRGWLVVDEAFMDTTPELSLLGLGPKPGLIVLRSLGKFFGLAGLRCGFVFAETDILYRLGRMLGPWTISHPTRWIATQALRDNRWQTVMSNQLKAESKHLKQLISRIGGTSMGGTDLFQTQRHDTAAEIYKQFALQGVLTRLLDNHTGIRFGLPGTESQWHRLERVISKIKR